MLLESGTGEEKSLLPALLAFHLSHSWLAGWLARSLESDSLPGRKMRERRMQNGPHCESFYGAAAAAQCDSLSRIRTFASPCQSRAGAAGRHTRTQLHRARRQRSSWSALFSGPDCVRSARSASRRCNRSSSNWPFWPLSHSLCLCKCLPISCGSGKEEDESTVVCAFVLEKTAFQPGRLPFIRAYCRVTQALAFASGSLAVGSPLQ